MIPAFDKLSNSETELMFKSPFLTCILIAGADGEVDRKEIRGAIELATKKLKKNNSALVDFYRIVGEDFEDKLKIVLQSYRTVAEKRNEAIIEELTALNAILPKLNNAFAVAFYDSLRQIAMGVATSSGGVLGMNKVGSKEARYVELSMIHPPS